MSASGFVALIALALAVAVAYRAGLARARAAGRAAAVDPVESPQAPAPAELAASIERRQPSSSGEAAPPFPCAERAALAAFTDDRAKLFAALADARAEIARWRQIVIDIERNAPPPLLDAPGTPDDLKLIVGVGPAIERILYQSGIATYRQIARLSEREIDAIEARLAEFPGRIRRDGWVAQARSLHVAKYGTNP